MSEINCATADELRMLEEWAADGKLGTLQGYLSGARWRHNWGDLDGSAVVACAERLVEELTALCDGGLPEP